ncbi:MAG: Rrf2 family transcriptional regulator [Streptococcaceae bacterium]|jgi:Rrf2 family protein|nr:Rrf2 family transcriptional regulator [Streptococcaceae bacterium]
MKISNSWAQSIFVLLALSRLPQQKTLTSLALAERLELSPTYLKKVMKILANESLVHSERGKGFCLARPLEDIDFYDVYLATEGRSGIFNPQNLLTPFLNRDPHDPRKCAVSYSMEKLQKQIEENMKSYVLGDMMNEILVDFDTADLDEWVRLNAS